MSARRLGGIEFLRFFFMIWICLTHIRTFVPAFDLKGAGIAVEFFFIISGFFLYRTFRSRNYPVLGFARNRFSRLYPVYLFGVILSTIISYADQAFEGTFIPMSVLCSEAIPEILMIQCTGSFSSGLANAPSWFVSVLFFGTLLIYAMLKYNEKLTTHILLPVFVIGFYTLITGKGIPITDLYYVRPELPVCTIGPLFLPLGRGIAATSIGVLMGYAWRGSGHDWGWNSRIHDLLALLSFALICLYFFIPWKNDALMLVPTTILASCVINPVSGFNKVFRHRIWGFLGGLSYGMLMLHIPVRFLINFGFRYFLYFRTGWLILYILITMLAAWLIPRLLERTLKDPHRTVEKSGNPA